MKDSWIIQIDQLQEWKELIESGDIETVRGQIDDILSQMEA